MPHFKPYANESDVVRIGALDIENRTDRITLTGDVVLTKDLHGLALAKELQALLNQVVQALEAEDGLPAAVQIKPARQVKNPF